MSRVLFTTLPAAGHVRPGLAIARQLVDAGHKVTWYTGQKFETLVEKTGARFVPVSAKLDFSDDSIDVLQASGDRNPGLSGLKRVIREVFIEPIPAYTDDLVPLFDEFDPDVVVADHTFMAGPLLARSRGTGSVFFTVGPVSLSSVDTAPFGMGLAPSSSGLTRLRNRAIQWMVRHVLLRDCQRLAERALMDIGSEPFDGLFMDWPPQIAGRYIHAGVPQFEYPRRDLPESVQFVGAMLPTGVDNWEPPAWWEEMLEARRNGRRVALVTQGTSSRNPEHLMLPAAEGLADQDLTVVLTTGGLDPETVLPAARRPANLRIEKFVPYTELLPFMDVMVTNGGYGGVQMSLAYGVPLVVAGQTDDRMEVNARVAWSGSGISLKTNQPSPAQVGRAVRTILDDPSFGARARELQAAYARYDGPSHAAEAIIAEARAMRSPSKARRESRPAEAPPTLEVAGVSTDD